jgi:hypothetical protein
MRHERGQQNSFVGNMQDHTSNSESKRAIKDVFDLLMKEFKVCYFSATITKITHRQASTALSK